MTTHRMPFILQRREKIVSGVLVTFILKQKITKDIGFTVWYKGNINEFLFGGGSGLKTLTGSAGREDRIFVQFQEWLFA